MAFPASPLPLVTELLIDGVWTDVTADRRIDGLSITRGRRDWGSRVTASQCSQVFENADGTYSNRNPSSPYYGKLGRNTQLRHRIRWILATFAVVAASSWPLADTGQAWTCAGGTASDYSGTGSVGQTVFNTLNASYRCTVAAARADVDLQTDFRLTAVPTGAAMTGGLLARYTDSSNYYFARFLVGTDSSVTLEIAKRVAGTNTTLTSVATGIAYSANLWLTGRLSVRGNRLRAKLWQTADPQPTTWLASTTDSSITAAGDVGTRGQANSGNTNVSPTAQYDNFQYSDYRFWGETSAFAPQWDLSGRNVTVPIDAAGILQRLSKDKPLRSAHTRAILGSATPPVGYWPLEDSDRATVGASPLVGVQPMTPATTTIYTLPSGAPIPLGGAPKFAAGVGPAGSAKLADFTNGGQLAVDVPTAADGQWSIEFVANWQPDATGVKTLMHVRTSGTYNFFQFDIGSADILVSHSTDGGSSTSGTASFTFDRTDATPHHFRYAVAQSGGNYDADLYLDGTLVDTADNFGSPMAGTVGHITQIQVNPLSDSGTAFPTAFGQVVVWSTQAPPIDTVEPAFGWDAELAAERLDRLCDELGIPFDLVGDSADTKQMGPQQIGPPLELLFAAADVDQGILFEPRDAFGLAYRTSASLYNQSGPTVSYTDGVLAPPFQPVEDDQLLVNTATVSRTGGGELTVSVDTGPLSTQDPPDGVGVVAAPTLDANLYADNQIFPLASWVAAKGTWDEARYPVARFEMAAPDLIADTALFAQIEALDLGDVFTVTDLPSWQPPGDAGLMIEGTSEFVEHGMTWSLSFNCVPAGPYTTGAYGTARYDSDTTTTAEALDSTETGVDITTSGTAPWVTTASDPSEFNFDIVIGGEQMTVTASTSTGAGTYTLTVTRSVNGVVKSHASGAAVHVLAPGYYTYS